jgi:hypothetical protein
VRLNREGLGQLTIPQDLDLVEPPGHKPLDPEQLLGYLGARLEALL